jgi:hypothetical protein
LGQPTTCLSTPSHLASVVFPAHNGRREGRAAAGPKVSA